MCHTNQSETIGVKLSVLANNFQFNFLAYNWSEKIMKL